LAFPDSKHSSTLTCGTDGENHCQLDIQKLPLGEADGDSQTLTIEDCWLNNRPTIIVNHLHISWDNQKQKLQIEIPKQSCYVKKYDFLGTTYVNSLDEFLQEITYQIATKQQKLPSFSGVIDY
jgi:hypothetical protein